MGSEEYSDADADGSSMRDRDAALVPVIPSTGRDDPTDTRRNQLGLDLLDP